jgi:hypothetical protein
LFVVEYTPNNLYPIRIMESLAFLGLLGAGYLASRTKDDKTAKAEGFLTGGTIQDAARAATGAGAGSGRTQVGDLDRQFVTPFQNVTIPVEPNPSQFVGTMFDVGVPQAKPVAVQTAAQVAAGVQLRPDSVETATPRPGFVSPLTGIAFNDGEFKHNNMVPFFRGQVKQNMYEGANRQILDSQTGADSLGYAKREQTPFFEPTKEPVGNPFGLESTTDFVESRMNAPMYRANERPMEAIRVGPGLNEGFTHIPSGGFQQQAGEDFVQERLPRTNDLRVATKPKDTYFQPVVRGSHFITTGGTAETVGEVRRYAPDTFYLNEAGERNFVTTGADVKAAVRSTQVLKDTTRKDTSKEYAGPAGQVEGNATYTVAAAKAPLVKQHGPFGWRNADASSYTNPNTDAAENDYGKSGVEILPNERYYTGERVHATNVADAGRETALHLQDAARETRAQALIDNVRSAGNFTAIGGGGMAEKPTVYDPNDVARTTIKEQTIERDWIGMAAPNEAQKLTVYDPDDIARVTGRNTLADWDMYRNVGRETGLENATTRLQDKVRNTQKAAISGKSKYTGVAVAAVGQEMNQTAARNVRHYAQKETIAQGRTPTNSSTKVFNGEDYVALQYRKIVADSVNDRAPVLDRVAGETTSVEALGVQRPRAALKLDVSAERNNPAVVSALERNPYVIPLHAAAYAGAERNTI